MTLSYEDIYANFLGDITDYNLLAQDTNDIYEIMCEYMHKAIAKPHLRALFSSVSFDDEIQELTYEMDYSVDNTSDEDFVKTIIAKGMVIEWVEPQVKSKVAMAQMFGGKEQNFYSQSSHLAQLRNILKDSEESLKKMIRDRDYIYNSYLDD